MPTIYHQLFFSKQEYTTALLDIKHDTSLRKIDFWLGKVSQEKVRLPLTLSDLLELRDRKVAIRIEICENGAVAFLEAEDDSSSTVPGGTEAGNALLLESSF